MTRGGAMWLSLNLAFTLWYRFNGTPKIIRFQKDDCSWIWILRKRMIVSRCFHLNFENKMGRGGQDLWHKICYLKIYLSKTLTGNDCQIFNQQLLYICIMFGYVIKQKTLLSLWTLDIKVQRMLEPSRGGWVG